ncbi:hypothetical protein ScPMuIL_004012 [Solemya velum]
MRRSAAPSQNNPAKRARFSAPFKKPAISSPLPTITECEANEVNEDENDTQCIGNLSSPLRVEKNPCIKPKTCKVSKFNLPLKVSDRNTNPVAVEGDTRLAACDKRNLEQEAKKERYFNVVWCKNSRKKHKKWEGDAVLVTRGRTVTLYDTEGKEIGKGAGYKVSELETLKEDETLVIGGKEIQVMSLMPEDQFKSCKCFATVASAPAITVPDTVVRQQKPFSNPQKSVHGGRCPPPEKNMVVSVKPRFDPSAPDALVLPRPSQEHQWQYNKRGFPIVDVVVDPFLSRNLRPHQREGVVFLYECVMGFRNYGGNGAILADDMGLGKTVQCITVLWTLYKQGPYGGRPVLRHILVITPGSLVKNWQLEFKKWLGTERLSVFAVSTDNRVEEFVKTQIYPVLIISYEMFVRSCDLLQQVKFDIIVCDEGHRLKNTAIKTTSMISSLPTKSRIVLTGTPIQNDLQEFYSIVEFCNPGILGTEAGFRRVYEDPILKSRQPGASSEQIGLGDERAAELSRLTKLFLLRRTQEINNKYLPPKHEVVIFCKPSLLQLCLYRKLLQSRLIRSCLSGNLAGAPHLVCIGALKKLCNHPDLVYDKARVADEANDEGESTEASFPVYRQNSFEPRCDVLHSGKLTVLSALLEETQKSSPGEKIVLVSNHTKTLDLLQTFCDSAGYKYLRLDGQTATNKRQEIVRHFNDKYCQEFVFLLSSKAGGVGLNLIGASRLVLYDIDWNPANDLQAMARIWRDGQKRTVYIYRLLTMGTLEEKVYQRQIIQFSTDDLKDIFSLNEATECDTHSLLGCTCGGAGDQIDKTTAQNVKRTCQLGQRINAQTKANLGMLVVGLEASTGNRRETTLM